MAIVSNLTQISFPQTGCSACAGMNAVYLVVKLHLTPVKHLEILRTITPAQRRGGGSSFGLLWQGRDLSPHRLGTDLHTGRDQVAA